MDGSVRDYQFDHSVAAGKNFTSTAGFGPWIVTADEVGDPSALEIATRLSGKEVQRGHTSDMLFGAASLVAYLSRIMPLEPGDVIATGTPEGVATRDCGAGGSVGAEHHFRPFDFAQGGLSIVEARPAEPGGADPTNRECSPPPGPAGRQRRHHRRAGGGRPTGSPR
jgi:2-keto-4-pentenoate hydratase/2-oxohepta-3-ene-1,7-dioic acid hydratase in catechol pathway